MFGNKSKFIYSISELVIYKSFKSLCIPINGLINNILSIINSCSLDNLNVSRSKEIDILLTESIT